MNPIITILDHFSIFVPETSLWGRKVLLFQFLDRELRHWRGQKSWRTYLTEQSLKGGSQLFLLLCKCSATESSYSSAPLLSISTNIYFANMKPSLGQGKSFSAICISPWVLPPPSDKPLWVSQAAWLHGWGTSTSQMCFHHSCASAQTSSTILHFPPCCKRYNCFLPPVPWGRLWSQDHWPVLLLFWFIRSVITVWPCFTYFIVTSIPAMLFFSIGTCPRSQPKNR